MCVCVQPHPNMYMTYTGMCCWTGYGSCLFVLNRVYSLTSTCPEQGLNLSYAGYGSSYGSFVLDRVGIFISFLPQARSGCQNLSSTPTLKYWSSTPLLPLPPPPPPPGAPQAKKVMLNTICCMNEDFSTGTVEH